MTKFKFEILTPDGRFADAPSDVDFLSLMGASGSLGVYAGHCSLVTTVPPTVAKLQVGASKRFYAVGGGILRVRESGAVLVVDSVETTKTLDVARAQAARKRAEDRLAAASKDSAIDAARAEGALRRALARIELAG